MRALYELTYELARAPLAVIAFVAMIAVAPDASAQVPYTGAPYCSLPASCQDGLVEDFTSYSAPVDMGTSFTTPNGFEISGPGLFIYDHPAIGNSLMFVCGGGSPFSYQETVIRLPAPSAWVTFKYVGQPATINFIAVNGSGEIVEAVTISSPGIVEQVKLGPGDPTVVDPMIETIHMWHVNDSCDYSCGEPFITDITACNTCGPWS